MSSLQRFERANARAILPGDPAMLPVELALLMVGALARQAASPTALTQVMLDRKAAPADWLRPEDGAFSGQVAQRITDWQAR